MNTIEKIVCAITSMKKMNLQYNDAGEIKTYIVHPHLLGRHKNTKNLVLSAYNDADSLEYGWKTFLLTKISKVILLDETFENAAPNYNPNDVRMETIVCNISQNR